MASTSQPPLNKVLFELHNFNDDFLLLRSDDERLPQLGRAIFERRFDFAEEVIVAEREICIQLNRPFGAAERQLLESVRPAAQTSAGTHEWPVLFAENGDWLEVERYTRRSRESIIRQLLDQEFRVAMFGFLPGFLYLTGLPPELHIPRKTTPATRVGAGSLAIGGPYLGVYSVESPGGWHVIGETLPPFDPKQLPPVTLHPGDLVRLRPIDRQNFKSPARADR